MRKASRTEAADRAGSPVLQLEVLDAGGSGACSPCCRCSPGRASGGVCCLREAVHGEALERNVLFPILQDVLSEPCQIDPAGLPCGRAGDESGDDRKADCGSPSCSGGSFAGQSCRAGEESGTAESCRPCCSPGAGAGAEAAETEAEASEAVLSYLLTSAHGSGEVSPDILREELQKQGFLSSEVEDRDAALSGVWEVVHDNLPLAQAPMLSSVQLKGSQTEKAAACQDAASDSPNPENTQPRESAPVNVLLHDDIRGRLA